MAWQCRRFSMIELVFVVGILFIVLTMFLGTYTRSRERARRVACQGNLLKIGLSVRMYCDEFEEYLPLSTGRSFQPLSDEDLLKAGAAYTCPSAFDASTDPANSNFVYVGSGRKLSDPAPWTTSAAYDVSGNHPGNDWMNLLYLDGHVYGHEPGESGETN